MHIYKSFLILSSYFQSFVMELVFIVYPISVSCGCNQWLKSVFLQKLGVFNFPFLLYAVTYVFVKYKLSKFCLISSSNLDITTQAFEDRIFFTA